LGTNGSCAYNNGRRERYRTNTLCVAVKAGGEVLIFDAGSGICGFNQLNGFQNERIHLFFSHYHLDHLNGLLFWNALFNPNKQVDIYGKDDARAAIESFFTSPFQPVNVNDFRACINFNSVICGEEIKINDKLSVKAKSLIHPNGCLGYRVDFENQSICYLTDIELAEYDNYDGLIGFVKNTDLLILDSAYADGKSFKGFGHSTPTECARLALQAQVKQLALYHYGFMESDEGIDELVNSAKKTFPNTFCSYDNLHINI
jgi:ribonuclease BN (tRNA processing enzyme)